MAFAYAIMILSILSIFMAGIVFDILVKNKDAGGLFILPLSVAGMFMGAILSRFETETAPIHSASVHQAIVLCETNGGLKTLDQREAICENGVAFNTRSLKQPEKE